MAEAVEEMSVEMNPGLKQARSLRSMSESLRGDSGNFGNAGIPVLRHVRLSLVPAQV